MDLQIDVMYAVDGYGVPGTGEEGGNTYWAWSLGDALYFSRIVPYGFTAGGSIKLLLEESSPSASKNHKWQVKVDLTPAAQPTVVYTETFTQEFVSSATANAKTDREIVIHTNGTIGGKHALPEDELLITVYRVAAATNEDSADIKMWTVVLRLGGIEGSTGQLPGRLGSIVAEVYERLNDVGINGLPVYSVVRQCNTALNDLAEAGLFKTSDTITLVSGQESYDLLSEFADFISLIDLRWTTTNTKIREARSHAEYQRIKQAIPSGVPFKYSLDNMTLKLIPVPSDTVTDTVTAFYIYQPTELDTMSNYNPPTPAAYDKLFVYWCLFAITQTYEVDTGRPGQRKSGEFFQLWKQMRWRLLGRNDSSTRRLRYYRM